MDYRWLSQQEIADFVNPVCLQRGWAQLNICDQQPTCCCIGAFEEQALVGWIVLQLFPMVGPVWCDVDHRDGTVSRELAAQMYQFLTQSDARSFMAVCESPVSERLCERLGMVPLKDPVYVKGV